MARTQRSPLRPSGFSTRLSWEGVGCTLRSGRAVFRPGSGSFCFALSDLPRLPATREKASVSVGGRGKRGGSAAGVPAERRPHARPKGEPQSHAPNLHGKQTRNEGREKEGEEGLFLTSLYALLERKRHTRRPAPRLVVVLCVRVHSAVASCCTVSQSAGPGVA